MSTCTLTDATVFFKPSERVVKFIEGHENFTGDVPEGIKRIFGASEPSEREPNPNQYRTLLTKQDFQLLEELTSCKPLQNVSDIEEDKEEINKSLLKYEDLLWIYDRVNEENQGDDSSLFHQLMEECKIVLPKNWVKPRDPELEKRCNRLKMQQDNDRYMRMTKNVDSMRRRLPEDTIAYQMKQLNSQLIAVFQFVISVVTGFAFGFIGLELFVGELDFGFRLLMGITCALIVALAEIYFLAKALNREYDDSVAASDNVIDEQTIAKSDDKVKLD